MSLPAMLPPTRNRRRQLPGGLASRPARNPLFALRLVLGRVVMESRIPQSPSPACGSATAGPTLVPAARRRTYSDPLSVTSAKSSESTACSRGRLTAEIDRRRQRRRRQATARARERRIRAPAKECQMQRPRKCVGRPDRTAHPARSLDLECKPPSLDPSSPFHRLPVRTAAVEGIGGGDDLGEPARLCPYQLMLLICKRGQRGGCCTSKHMNTE